MPLEWEYSRSQQRHWCDLGDSPNHRPTFEIKDCRKYGSIHLPQDGYDLYRFGKKIRHALTVKTLKDHAADFIEAKTIFKNEPDRK